MRMCTTISGGFDFKNFSQKWFCDSEEDTPLTLRPHLSLNDIHEFYCFFSQANSEDQAEILVRAELCCFLERYVWPCFPHRELYSLHEERKESCFDKSSHVSHEIESVDTDLVKEKKHLKSVILVIALIINEKFRQKADIWTILQEDKDSVTQSKKLRILFLSAWFLFLYPLEFSLHLNESVILLQLFIHVYQSLEHDIVRGVCMPTCSLRSWFHLSESMQDYLLENRPELKKPWNVLVKRSWEFVENIKSRLDSKEEKNALCYLDIQADFPGLTLEERFLLIERDALFSSLNRVIQLAEGEWAKAISPENLLTRKESLQAIPKTMTDVFLGTYRGNVEAQVSWTQEMMSANESKAVTPQKQTDLASLTQLRNENPSDLSHDILLFLERFLELNIDLLAQLPTRRFFRPLFMAQQPIVRLRNTATYYFVEAGLVRQLVAILSTYMNFEVDDNTGEPLNAVEMESQHYNRLMTLQKFAFQHLQKDYPQFKKMALCAVAKYDSPSALRDVFENIPVTVLLRIADHLKLVDALSFALTALEPLFSLCHGDSCNVEEFRDTTQYKGCLNLLVEVLVEHLCRVPESLTAINKLPLFPTECLLWDPNIIPTEGYQGNFSLALPKLNLQFLTIRDYLLRNFHLFRLESAYEIRQHIEETIARMEPRLRGSSSLLSHAQYSSVVGPYATSCRSTEPSMMASENKSVSSPVFKDPYGTDFRGSSRWAVPIERLSIVFVKPPRLGEEVASEVRGEIIVDLERVPQDCREEWDRLRVHDVLFLAAIQLPASCLREDLGLSTLRRLSTVVEFPELFGVLYIRGCQVVDVLDEEGESLCMMDRGSNPSSGFFDGECSPPHDPYGSKRTYRVLFDCYQHHADMIQQDHDNIYSTFNLLIRRAPAENNFKAVLETIRQLMNDSDHTVIPYWLHDLFLGYGDPRSAQYFHNKDWFLSEIDFYDTFLDEAHVRESFPDIHRLHVIDCQSDKKSKAFLTRMTFSPDFDPSGGSHPSFHPPQDYAEAKIYSELPRSPYPCETPRLNTLRFTRAQVECIKSGIHQGLTMIVGPPGTGKTDTAVQIINLLHRNFPEERVLIIAHSNQALNDLFDKIVALDIDERYLLRLGAGEKELHGASDETLHFSSPQTQSSTLYGFSKQGRVNHMLQKRLVLLEKVTQLGRSLCVTSDVGSSCEYAIQFFKSHVVARIQRFWKHFTDLTPSGKGLRVVLRDIREADKTSTQWLTKRSLTLTVTCPRESHEATEPEGTEGTFPETSEKLPSRLNTVEERDDFLCKQFYQGQATLVECLFPFHDFFRDVPGELFPKSQPELHLTIAQQCFMYLTDLLKQIQECHAFELLRNFHDQSEYLLTRQAKITAMTCTHAALARQQLIEMRFTYSTLLIEESAQILEVETFIPILLQKSVSSEVSRLKRVILIGDHHQLPPVVKNKGFQHYGRLDQSMFTRFIRLQVPYIQLDAQGRCRSILRELFDWRYTHPCLGDLPAVNQKNSMFSFGNPGFYFTHQWVDVLDFNGQGESTVPLQPHVYQNLGEAEFLVAVFMYMRLLGYPAKSIVLLTTYNGQRQLIRDIVRQRCGWNPVIGWPAAISTVDRFQGQQADYVLISLVRTRRMGYLRDIRRMIVAVSRARLGLYVFGRLNLLKQCHEWNPILKRLVRHTPVSGDGTSLVGSLVLYPNQTFQKNALPPLCPEETKTTGDPSPNIASACCEPPVLVSNVNQMWALLKSSTQRVLAEIAEAPAT